MLYKPSKELDRFCDTVMDGDEWKAYVLHFERLLKEQNRGGHFSFFDKRREENTQDRVLYVKEVEYLIWHDWAYC
jgi:hypothetical protein